MIAHRASLHCPARTKRGFLSWSDRIGDVGSPVLDGVPSTDADHSDTRVSQARRASWRRWSWRAVRCVAISYLLILLAMMWFETSLIFPRWAIPAGNWAPTEFSYDDVFFHLGGWHASSRLVFPPTERRTVRAVLPRQRRGCGRSRPLYGCAARAAPDHRVRLRLSRLRAQRRKT